ncbi:putative transcription factor bZIP family [Medicago truncatula]|uniref:BZIP transcription factor n=1 Tax=Medicago truncatula TaxID=3880 RepID=G7KST5_MEDTR|nr:bZIP transcription factor 53 [Medicago truncatula]AES82186.1 BZIP transcription factor [Medicago truncatula]RHN49016.1 putative transcription factor bZIP family [Medicago truncatula]
MASVQRVTSSGSDGVNGAMDERKRKRMISNRESARRSRERKQKLLEDYQDEANRLRNENRRLSENIRVREEGFNANEAANGVLRAQTQELTDQLKFLKSIIEKAEREKIPKIPDPQLNPWQMLYPTQTIRASDWFLH